MHQLLTFLPWKGQDFWASLSNRRLHGNLDRSRGVNAARSNERAERGLLQEHSEIMKKVPNMEHEDAHLANVRAGANGQLVGQFNKPGESQLACLIPGQFEAGMNGKGVVK
jgi:uncharacterized cupredoxin-like copper-binding protein